MDRDEKSIEWLFTAKSTDPTQPDMRVGIDRSTPTEPYVSPLELVSAEEFRAYIKSYPHILHKNVAGIYDPPILQYYDPITDEIVGYVDLFDGGTLEEQRNKPYEYHLLKNRKKD